MAVAAMSRKRKQRERLPLALMWTALALTGIPLRTLACDICAIYTATELQESRTGLRLGLAEQFTRFATLQADGHKIDNPAHERLESSITQLIVGYGWHPRFLLQLNMPVIHRSFRRATANGVERDEISGVGDISIHAFATLFHRVQENSLQRLACSLGIELPTGSPRRLREELTGEDSLHSDIPPVFRGQRFRPRHSGPAVRSGIHGHDLTLGSGSTDVILSAQWLGTYRRLYGTLLAQYFVRTPGSYDYTFADETIVSGGPGLFLWTRHDSTLGIQSVLTLDTKGTDTLNGTRLGDTGATFLYVGPAAHWTWQTNLSLDLGIDIPVVRNNTSLQIVPDLRLRGGFVWRF